MRSTSEVFFFAPPICAHRSSFPGFIPHRSLTFPPFKTKIDLAMRVITDGGPDAV